MYQSSFSFLLLESMILCIHLWGTDLHYHTHIPWGHLHSLHGNEHLQLSVGVWTVSLVWEEGQMKGQEYFQANQMLSHVCSWLYVSLLWVPGIWPPQSSEIQSQDCFGCLEAPSSHASALLSHSADWWVEQPDLVCRWVESHLCPLREYIPLQWMPLLRGTLWWIRSIPSPSCGCWTAAQSGWVLVSRTLLTAVAAHTEGDMWEGFTPNNRFWVVLPSSLALWVCPKCWLVTPNHAAETPLHRTWWWDSYKIRL